MAFNRRGYSHHKYFNHPFLFTILGIFLLVLIAIPLKKNLQNKAKVDEEIAKLQQEIASLDNKSNDLGSFIEYLESDQFAEKEARLNLGYKKPGEEVVVVKNANPTPVVVGDDNEYEKNLTNPQRWWRYFFN